MDNGNKSKKKLKKGKRAIKKITSENSYPNTSKDPNGYG